MSGRKPRKDELELWSRVAQTARAIPKSQSTPEYTPPPKLRAASTAAPEPHGSEKRFKLTGRAGQMAHDLVPEVTERLSGQPVRMDRKTFRNLQRGKMRPDARIDLHGMTLERAHSALTRFILSAHVSEKRLLLVITGKGKHRDTGGPIPVRQGVLRHQVPEWLRLPPLSTAVLQVTTAHVSHGGAGAYYVYLRKSR